MKIVLLTTIIIALSILLLGVKVFFVKGGKFPSAHAHNIMEKHNARNNFSK
jgi:multisubunit Na+/H+ antiporter MnhC subunit